MVSRLSLLRWVFLVAAALAGCSPGKVGDWALDSAIPRIETPTSQIAYVGTTWVNGYQRQTTLYDQQGRVLETFAFGRSNAKTLNHYENGKNVLTIQYGYNDSSLPGVISVDTIRRIFDKAGKLVADKRMFTHLHPRRRQTVDGDLWRSFTHTSLSDTIITRRTYRDHAFDRYVKMQQVDVNQWEHDRPGRAIRHYRLYVAGPTPLDTMYHYSQRFAYDSSGRRVMAWFEFMHLGQFYSPAGPDTIRYAYDRQGRVIREVHRYTTDKRNKREVDMASLSASDRESVAWYKRKFYEGDEYFPKNDKIDLVEHRYEPFNFYQHIPLRIPVDVGN